MGGGFRDEQISDKRTYASTEPAACDTNLMNNLFGIFINAGNAAIAPWKKNAELVKTAADRVKKANMQKAKLGFNLKSKNNWKNFLKDSLKSLSPDLDNLFRNLKDMFDLSKYKFDVNIMCPNLDKMQRGIDASKITTGKSKSVKFQVPKVTVE